MIQNIESLPVKEWSSSINGHFPSWMDDMSNNAFTDLARDKDYNRLPSALVLSIGIKKISVYIDYLDAYSIEEELFYEMKVYVFKNNMDMNTWVINFGVEKIYELNYIK